MITTQEKFDIITSQVDCAIDLFEGRAQARFDGILLYPISEPVVNDFAKIVAIQQDYAEELKRHEDYCNTNLIDAETELASAIAEEKEDKRIVRLRKLKTSLSSRTHTDTDKMDTLETDRVNLIKENESLKAQLQEKDNGLTKWMSDYMEVFYDFQIYVGWDYEN